MFNNCVHQIKALALDTVQNAKSGHQGMILSAGELLSVLYFKHLKINPEKPDWINRDRFVMSAGHGSALLYSILSAAGFLKIEDLKSFRKLGSNTPGHPETETAGVDCGTGPLGQGVANAVGMAIAETQLNAKYPEIIDHFTYCLAGDGCLQEGVAWEAISLAGLYKLNKFILLYDSNNATLDAKIGISSSDDIAKKFAACNFNVIEVDGHNVSQIDDALSGAKKSDLPTVIICHTKIAKDSVLEGSNKAHGIGFGQEEIDRLKKLWKIENPPFIFSAEVQAEFEKFKLKKLEIYEKQQAKLNDFKLKNPAKFKEISEQFEIQKFVVENFEIEKALSTRELNCSLINNLAKKYDNIISLAADVFSSTKTYLEGLGDYSLDNRLGRNIFMGIREHAMGAISNGIALHGGLVPICSTYLTFSDYMRPAIRMAALMHLRVIFCFTHDSISVGEDGPTHQSIEQIDSLRLIPDLEVFRPCNESELVAGYYLALNNAAPACFILTRQAIMDVRSNLADALHGGYLIGEIFDKPHGIMLTSGSEVGLCLHAQQILKGRQIAVNVVSIPNVTLFERQAEKYKQSVLPPKVKARLAVEMSTAGAFYRYLGDEGGILNITRFGKSADYESLLKAFNFTVKNVVLKMQKLIR